MKLAKNVGKAALTVACPPVGFACYGTGVGEKILMGVLGAGMSLILSGGVKCLFGSREIYDNPVVTERVAPSDGDFLKGIISPIWFYSTFEGRVTATQLGSERDSIVYGKVINFRDGKHTLDFPVDRTFVYDGRWRSLDGYRERMDKLEERVYGEDGNGSISDARKLGEMRVGFSKLSDAYDEV